MGSGHLQLLVTAAAGEEGAARRLRFARLAYRQPDVEDAQVIQFRLVQYPNTVPMPLGWLLSLHTRGAIDAQVGKGAEENGPALARVAALLQRTALPDPTQQSAEAAPAVARMTGEQ